MDVDEKELEQECAGVGQWFVCGQQVRMPGHGS